MSDAPFWLSAEQFSRLEPHLPQDTRGKAGADDRRVISGIIHVLKSGCRWVDAPSIYGPRKTLYNRFVRWGDKGIWQGFFKALVPAGGPPAEVLIDSSAVKAHRCAAGGKGGNGRRRLVARGVVGRENPCPDQRRALGLGPEARVLLIATEGATDPALYEQYVGRAPEAVG